MNYPRLPAAICFFLCILLLDLRLLYDTPRPLQSSLADKVLRFHIIADSDSEEAQNVKYLVRDAVLAYIGTADAMTDKEAACTYLSGQLDTLREIAQQVLTESGFSYPAAVSLERRYFPIKTYGEYSFPAGEYDALCITLGSGEGKNWWCLAFPRLCFLDGSFSVTDADTDEELKILLTDEEYEAILKQEPKVRLRFRLFEWFRGLFKK